MIVLTIKARDWTNDLVPAARYRDSSAARRLPVKAGPGPAFHAFDAHNEEKRDGRHDAGHGAAALLLAPLPTPERVAAWVRHRPIGAGGNRREEIPPTLLWRLLTSGRR
jgi:hypothetical protein